MTYDALASSVESSRPVEIYTLVQGGTIYRWTSAEDQIVIASNTYEVEKGLKRGKIGQSPEDRSSILEIEVRGTNVFAQQYAASNPAFRVQVTIQRFQRDDGGSPEIITIFEGFVSSVAFENDNKIAKIACSLVTAATSRLIPRFTYQNLCNHVLYDTGCKVEDTDSAFRHTNAVTLVDGANLTVTGVAAFGADWFTAGFVEADGGNDARLVLASSGDILQLLLPFPANITGETVTVLAGCDHTIGVCDSKFFTPEDTLSNVINYGGYAFVPLRNPYTSGLQ